MDQIRNVNQAMDTLIQKLSDYKYASTSAADTAIANDARTAESKATMVQSVSNDIDTELTYMEQFSQRTAATMQRSFSELFIGVLRGEFESFEEFGLSVLQRLQQNAVDMLAEMATQELFGALSGGGKDSGGSGGWLNTAGNLIGGIVGLFGEKGLAYNAAGPGVTFMARGGVFNRPFAVPMANGGVAIGSEYGQEEAIMPLARTSSGHLGVRSQKDRGAQIVNNTHNTWEVKAIDPKSFADVCERNPQAIIGPLNSELERGNKDLISNLKMIKGG